ncbi:hypothetical protein PAE4_20253 [Bacillus altitudinis]|nr:hypothetical protein PAE4_20253 [Bacillus altitudinis]
MARGSQTSDCVCCNQTNYLQGRGSRLDIHLTSVTNRIKYAGGNSVPPQFAEQLANLPEMCVHEHLNI